MAISQLFWLGSTCTVRYLAAHAGKSTALRHWWKWAGYFVVCLLWITMAGMFWSEFPSICMDIASADPKTKQINMPNQKGPTLGRSGFLHWVELHPGRQYRSGGSRLSPYTCSSLPWDDVTSRPYCSVVCLSLDTITTMFWSDFPNICMNIAKKEENYNSTIASSSKTFKKLQKVTKS